VSVTVGGLYGAGVWGGSGWGGYGGAYAWGWSFGLGIKWCERAEGCEGKVGGGGGVGGLRGLGGEGCIDGVGVSSPLFCGCLILIYLTYERHTTPSLLSPHDSIFPGFEWVLQHADLVGWVFFYGVQGGG